MAKRLLPLADDLTLPEGPGILKGYAMKKLAKYLSILVLVLLLTGWLLLNIFDANQLKKPVLGWLNEHSNIHLAIGNLEFNPLHPYTLLAEDVQLGEWFSAKQVYVELAHLSPLSNRTRIATLDVIDAQVQLDKAGDIALPSNLANIKVDEFTSNNLSVNWQSWQAKGLDITLNNWQPRRDSTWQWWSEAQIKGQLRQLTHPHFAMTQVSFRGQVADQQLQLTQLQSRLFDGLFDAALTLNMPQQMLTLTEASFSHNRVQFEQLPPLDTNWRLQLNRATFTDVSITSPQVISNGISGELRYFEWQAGGLPDARGYWQADEAVLDWLRLDQHEGELLSRHDRLDLSVKGQAYEGSFNSELRWTPTQARLDIDTLQLADNKLIWQPELYWPTPDIRLHKLNVSQIELLSLDADLPLSVLGANAFITDLAWSAGQWRPLSEQARLEASWDEIAFNSIVARHGHTKARLDDTKLTVEQLNTELLNGQWSMQGEVDRYSPYAGQLQLTGAALDIRPLYRWQQGAHEFSGILDIQGSLQGELNNTQTWQGQLAMTGQDVFIEKVGIDTWLKARLIEDYRQLRQVDPKLAALDLNQSDAFIYQMQLAGPVNQGRWQLDGSALQSVRHLLAVRGQLDFAGAWQLELGAINESGCRELAIALSNTWRAPQLSLHQPKLAIPCKPWYRGAVPYPKSGLSGSILQGVRALQLDEEE
ncbi:MAG: AsmA family protein [Oceanisphaera sp.]|uniref:AsmA family protein n=1 Tax=Oceanisphaera sp. TaxID=1929979 RepID=UPI003F9E6CB0